MAKFAVYSFGVLTECYPTFEQAKEKAITLCECVEDENYYNGTHDPLDIEIYDEDEKRVWFARRDF